MRKPQHILKAIHNRFTLRAERGPIGVGLIGVGGWGASNAANIMRCRRFTICGVYDKQEQSAHRFANRFNTKYYHQLDSLLNDSDIKAIVATVPNPFHVEIVKAAADAGKHIFIEKPLASDPDDCRELGRYCLERKVILQVGHQTRREPVFGEMKRIMKSGVLGRALYAQAVCTMDRSSRDDWRRDAQACPGGSMEQLGVHLIDVFIDLFGLPLHTQGWAENIPRRLQAPDWGYVSMSFAHGVHGSVSTSFSSPRHVRLEVFFDQGHMVVLDQTLWISRAGSKASKVKPHGIAGGIVQFAAFADCIEQGREPETGATEAAAVMDVVRSMYHPREM